MNYLRIKEDKIESVKNDNNFILGLQLARILNIINSNHRQFFRIQKEEESHIINRDKIEIIIYHVAITYEALNSIFKHAKILSTLSIWKNNKTIQQIQKSYNDKNSFINKCLKIIRNQMIFHYDFEPMKDMFISLSVDKNSSFAEYKKGLRLDYIFTLVDEILINFVVNTITDKKSDIEKWNLIQSELLDLSNNIAEFLFELLLELIKDFVEIVNDDK